MGAGLGVALGDEPGVLLPEADGVAAGEHPVNAARARLPVARTRPVRRRRLRKREGEEESVTG